MPLNIVHLLLLFFFFHCSIKLSHALFHQNQFLALKNIQKLLQVDAASGKTDQHISARKNNLCILQPLRDKVGCQNLPSTAKGSDINIQVDISLIS